MSTLLYNPYGVKVATKGVSKTSEKVVTLTLEGFFLTQKSVITIAEE